MSSMSTLLTFIFLLSTILNSPTTRAAAVKGAYWPTWAAETLPSSAIETSLFTHIYYAFLSPSSATYTLQVSQSDVALLSNFTSGLRTKRPQVKTLISINGASDIFAAMASTGPNRKAFIDSSIEVARRFGFDGLDLDWESPENPKQMQDFGLLLEEWRAAVTKEGQATGQAPLLLTAAVYFASDFFARSVYRAYPARSMAQQLDFINAMCYDLHGSWDTVTGAHAAFFDPNSNISSSYGLRSWIKAGMPREKIIMGLPLYGMTWKLKDPKVNGIGAPVVGLGPGDKSGNLPYYQVEEFNEKNKATVVYDKTTVSTYSYSGTSWVGYDDVQSTTEKIRLAQDLGIGGYFFWALSDDSNWKISTQASRAWVM